MKRIYLNLVLSIVAMLGVSSLVFADDRHYAPPAKLENCRMNASDKTASNLKCDYDNTFIKLINGSANFLPGTYQLSKATASFYHDRMAHDYRIRYEYVNKQGGNSRVVYGEVAYNMIQPDVEAPGSQWKDAGLGDWVCESGNRFACGFTHTPWSDFGTKSLKQPPQVQALSKSSGSEDTSGVKGNAALLKGLFQAGSVTIHNNSPYPIFIQKGDFNTADLLFPESWPTAVPAKTVKTVVNYLRRDRSSAVVFTIQLWSGNPNIDPTKSNRNADNTAVFVVGGDSQRLYNDELFVGGQRFNVWADFDIDTGVDIGKNDLNFYVGPM